MFDFNGLSLSMLRKIDPEISHNISLWALKKGLYFKNKTDISKDLTINLKGMKFNSPVGLAAGFDKNAEIFNKLHDFGFGFAEVGTVTPKAQQGNPKPRIFRLKEDLSVINRLGFNNLGAKNIVANLKLNEKKIVLGVNIGKNKLTDDPIYDYVITAKKVAPFSDYLTINISSPNTPNLRDLQTKKAIIKLVKSVKNAIKEEGQKKPIFLKIAPDLKEEQLQDVIDALVEVKIDAIIISNTTINRYKLKNECFSKEIGGLSGKALFVPSTQMLKETFKITKGKIPLIGVGGIMSRKDAYEKIINGASLIQLYTGLIYKGPKLINEINNYLEKKIKQNKVKNIKDLIGLNLK